MGGATTRASPTPSSIVFTPLTDTVAPWAEPSDASISIGALTVQPGGTGVILAGTGDPNDVLDSYYGAGILRSTDGGNTWSLIQQDDGRGRRPERRRTTASSGEGFAGFAWSTVNPQVVVAAVSQAYEGTLVDAGPANSSYEGLYYSSDSGATWHLATITDGTAKTCKARSMHSRRRTATPPQRWCGTRCGSCLWPRCAITAITSRPTASPGRA